MSTRDIRMDLRQIRAMFRSGPFGWLEEIEKQPLGLLARADVRQLQDELNRSFDLGSLEGDEAYAPSRSWAFRWGVRKNQIAVMAHSGSRRVGVIVGQSWMQHAKEQWPVGVAHPSPCMGGRRPRT
jgi:tRNA-splicing ligase RtcB